ncbi:MAG: hypothetical protein ABH872_02495 [Candidatus Omnitrophota bacterium]
MDKIDELLKQYLKANSFPDKALKTPLCPDETILSGYMQKNISNEECEIIEAHIAGCGFCLSQLSLWLEASKVSVKKLEKTPRTMVNNTKTRLNMENSVRQTKPIKRHSFGICALIFFIISFFIHRYFMQFLAAALILGMRWVFDSEGGRTLIMVIDSWRRHSRDDDDEISRRLKDRHTSFHQ